MWPSPPAPITHAGGARVEQRDGLADRVVGGDAGVGERGDVLRLGLRVELDAGPRRGEQVLGHPAVARQAGERAVDAVHVVAGPAGAAQPAGRRRVQDHRVADGHVGDRGADLVHPAGVLVAERVGQRRVHRRVPLALDDVQVGAADPGAADLHDDVERAAEGRARVPRRRRASGGTRAGGRPSSAPPRLVLMVPYRCRSMPRQMLPFASMLTRVVPGPAQVQRQASAPIGAPVAGSISSGASSPAGRPELGPPRRAAAPASGDGGHVAQRQRGQLVGRCRPAASSGRHTRSVPASTALRRKSARSSSSSPTASPSNDSDEAGPGGHPAVDRVGGEVVVQHHLGPAHARHAR